MMTQLTEVILPNVRYTLHSLPSVLHVAEDCNTQTEAIACVSQHSMGIKHAKISTVYSGVV